MVRGLEPRYNSGLGTNTDLMQTRVLPVYTAAESEDEAAPPVYTPICTQPQTTTISDDANLQIWPLPDIDGLMVTVAPPPAPQDEKLSHVPCDIVLVIDVSGSMSTEARIPGGSDQETTGLSVLDLVKHACRTILTTLDERDRLGIITFSNRATEIQQLTVMTDINKKRAEEKIEKMYVQGATNLWAGLRKGIECLNSESNTSRVPAVMILTDGLPNHMCPPGGYVPALRQMGNILPTIHTFGFGFHLRSGLLKSIAEYGRGNYSFIPDTGMIGTVFVHAVANLQSTFATNAVLKLAYPEHITIEQTAGSSVGQHEPELMDGTQIYHLTIPLGNIQYGQSRDIFFRRKSNGEKHDKDEDSIEAALTYDLEGKTKATHSHTRLLKAYETPFTSAEIAYHISRHKILSFLASLFPIDALGEHRPCIPPAPKRKKPSGVRALEDMMRKNEDKKKEHEEEEEEPLSGPLKQKQEELRDLVATLPAANFPKDPQCASLMQDLISPEPFGQVSLALSKDDYFQRWGQHYLPSIHGAHARQLCNSFKDPGPLQYGVRSTLFIQCRNALNSAFDDLPPPTPSLVSLPDPDPQANGLLDLGRLNLGPPISARGPLTAARDGPLEPDGGDLLRSHASSATYGGRYLSATDSMKRYNHPSLPCFAGRTLVTLAGGSKVPISTVKGGMNVVTPEGPKKVAAVVITPVKRVAMVKLEGVLVTPWHPVTRPGVEDGHGVSSGWMFPCHASQERVRYTGCIYSILLERAESTEAHAIMLGGGSDRVPFWGVTLGHGILTGLDTRAHRFFGNYIRVMRSLKRLQVTSDGRFVTGGTKRSTKTGLVVGFQKCPAGKPIRLPRLPRSAASIEP